MRALVIALVMAIAAPAFAQAPGQTPPAGPGARPMPPPPGPVGPDVRRERIKKRIRGLRAATLTTELDLDATAAGKLFPLLAKYDDEFERLLVQHADLQRQLDAAADSRDNRAIERVIDAAIANQRALWDLEDKRLAEIRKLLTPAQVARLLVVLPAWERKIQNQLRNAITKANKPGRKRALPDEDDDDDIEPGEKPARPVPPAQRRAAPPRPPPCDPFDSKHGCR
jgi:Spy/CpxP family protein refolding chaperone